MGKKNSGEKLLSLFTQAMAKSDLFIFISGLQPFKISFKKNEYFIYIKNISSAYFKNRPDVYRAQLPQREEFNFIKQSSIPFIFLGYDEEFDVYVCWDYYISKNRLNIQDNVSFYSRKSWHYQAKENVFLEKKLTNNDRLVIFKRKNLINFFEQIETFFADSTEYIENKSTKDNIAQTTVKLYKITDIDLLEKLKPLLTGSSIHTLEAIQLVEDFYQNKYPTMTYKDWSILVKTVKFK